MKDLLMLIHNPVLHGALIALITAIGVDLHAWKSWGDAEFNLKTASFRWFSALFFGAAAGAGLNTL